MSLFEAFSMLFIGNIGNTQSYKKFGATLAGVNHQLTRTSILCEG